MVTFAFDRFRDPLAPAFFIAEAGVNHNGDMELARKLVAVAAEAGADAIKFQTFEAEALATAEAPQAAYQERNTGRQESQREMLKRLELSRDQFRVLAEECGRRGILFLSTPFDEGSADFLRDLGMPVFKVPSGEITNLPFLEHLARLGRPLILSTGMSTLEEVRTAVQAVRRAGNDRIVLLHCVSNYPAELEEVNLRAMETLRREIGVPVGYSDHTLGGEAVCAAVAAGARVVEKHFTLDCALPGPDHRASLEPEALAGLIRRVRTLEKMLGHGRKEPVPSELETARVARRSLVAAVDIGAGTRLEREHVAIRRPGTGMAPQLLDSILGKTARRAIAAGSLLAREMID